MKNRLVFFVTDKGYLLPSTVAALQVSQQVQVTAIADIIIFLLDIPDEEIDELNAAFAATGIVYKPLDSARIQAACDDNFTDTHLSKAALGRLVVSDMLPGHFEHLVYFDGDVQVVGDIAPLVRHAVEQGKILAAPDSTMIVSRDGTAFATDNDSYTRALGLSSRQSYFNSGVLAARRAAWAEISEDALRFFNSRSTLCRYHDQSALNAVAIAKREILHPNFNFLPTYHRVGTRLLKPAIIHFIGPNKPWHPATTPWLRHFHKIYETATNDYPVLKRYPAPGPTAAARQAVAKASRSGPMAWLQRRSQRKRLDAYLRKTRFEIATP